MEEYLLLQEKMKMLDAALKEARKRGLEYAEAEKAYQIAKNEAVLLLRSNNTPATLIQLMVKGEKDVANKMIVRDIAKVLYESAQEAVNVYKLEIRVLQSNIEREWNNVERISE